MARRPKTQRELRKEEDIANEFVIVENVSNQTLNIQLTAPRTGRERPNFYLSEQTIRLKKGTSAKFRADQVYINQLNNLKKMGKVRYRMAIE